MRVAAIMLLVSSGCMARLGETGRDQAGSVEPDAGTTQSEPDADTPSATPDAAPDASTYLAACMAKGYMAGPSGSASLYRRAATSKNWPDAAAECNADVPGATHLVVLSAQTEVDYIKANLGWVGLSDRATEGTFVNVTLEPNDLRPFSSGQPDNGSGTEDCAQMKSDGLDDDQCDNSHAYVCECDGRAPQ